MYYVFEYITNVEIYCQNLNMQHATMIHLVKHKGLPALTRSFNQPSKTTK